MKPNYRYALITSIIFSLFISIAVFYSDAFLLFTSALISPNNVLMNGKDLFVIFVSSISVFLMSNILFRHYLFERKKNEGIRMEWVKIIESEEKYRTLINRISDGFFSLDKKMRFTYANEKLTAIGKKAQEELIGRHINEVFPGSDKTETFKAVERALKDQIYISVIDYYEPLELWQENHIYPSTDGVSIFVNDISEQKKMELNVQKHDKRFKALIENSEDIISLMDADGKIIYVSPALERVSGYSADEMCGRSLFEFMPSGNVSQSTEKLNVLLSSPGLLLHTTNHLLLKNGGHIIIEGTVLNALQDKNVNAIVCNFRDITEKRKNEEAIRESESLYKNLFENLSHGFAYCEAIFEDEKVINYRYMAVNDAYETLTGLKNVVGKTVQEMLPRFFNAHRDYFELLTNVINNNRPSQTEIFVETLGKWYAVSIYSPKKGYFVGLFDDITEKKTIDQEREFDRNNLESLINNTGDLMWSVDRDFHLITYNKPFERMIKLFSGSAIAKGMSVLIPEFDKGTLEYFEKNYQRAFTGESFTEVYHYIDQDGWVETSFYPIYKGSEVIGTACFSKDITERKRYERDAAKNADEKELFIKELSQNNKNLQQFAYITSHNLRGPIASLMGLTNLLSTFKIEDATLKQILAGIQKATFRFDETIRDLNTILTVKDSNSLKKESLLLTNSFEKTLEQCEVLIKESKARVTYDFRSAPIVDFNKAYLESIFLNLLTNALKYKSPSRALTIEVHSKILKNHVILRFSDNGIGMDLESVKEKLFQPYQRFHDHTEGKGLGLFLIKSQLETFGGSIEIESDLNKGTQFIIKFSKTKS